MASSAGAEGNQPKVRRTAARAVTGLLHHSDYRLHNPGSHHPEQPARYDAVIDALEQAGLKQEAALLVPRPATEEELALCHARDYIGIAKRDIANRERMLSTGDTHVSEHSWDIALQAVGGVLRAVEAVIEGEARNAFSVVRPPGHHATPDRGMGFCIFNNIAIAARYAQHTHGVSRVLIADWDVHHGNGTQDIFYRDPSVFFFSTHQSPWYPGTGAAAETGVGQAKGTTLNCPFPAGSGREEILGAFKNKLLLAAREFKPELVLLSAGFDSRKGDPLGQFTLDDNDFRDLTQVMLEIAAGSAGGRLISVLEGGYNLAGLGSAAAAHVKALTGA